MSLGIKRTRPLRVASKSVECALGDVPNEFEDLLGWARRRNLRVGEPDPSGRMNLAWIAVLHDDEDTTAETVRPVDLWIPIEGAGPTQGDYEVKDIAHENVAFMIHRGPMTRYEEAIQTLFDWATNKELPFRSRIHRRIYLRGIDGPQEDPDWEAEIQIPLVPQRS